LETSRTNTARFETGILIREAERADDSLSWPAASWVSLKDGGVLRWPIPETFGGDELDSK